MRRTNDGESLMETAKPAVNGRQNRFQQAISYTLRKAHGFTNLVVGSVNTVRKCCLPERLRPRIPNLVICVHLGEALY